MDESGAADLARRLDAMEDALAAMDAEGLNPSERTMYEGQLLLVRGLFGLMQANEEGEKQRLRILEDVSAQVRALSARVRAIEKP